MLAQFKTLSRKDQRTVLSDLKNAYAEALASDRAAKATASAVKAQRKAEKTAAAIQKAQARLQKLLEKQAAPVGIKATKANRKPSKVTTFGAEDNAIAAAIMARKTTNIAAIRQA